MEIPEGWSKSQLGDYVKIISGEAPSKLNFCGSKNGVPYVKVEDMNNCSKLQLASRFYVSNSKKKVQSGSVIFPKRGAAIMNNKVRVAATEIALDTNMMALVPSERLLSEFLYYKLVDRKLFKIADTSTIPQINNKHINPYWVLFPPLSEQRRIAEILGTWDRAIAVTEALIAQSEAQKKALMQELLTGKRRLPGFEGEWRDVKMSKLGDVTSGGTPKSSKSEYWDGTIPWLTPTDVTSLKSDFVDVTPRMITMSGVESSSAKLLPVGSLLVCTRATIGAMAINTVPMATNQGFKNITPNSDCDIQFLLLLLKQKKNDLLGLGCGSTFLEVSKSDFSKLELNVPPVEEQVAVRMVIDNAEQQRLSLAAKLQTLKTEKAALMQQLLTGKRRVKLTEAA